MTVRTQQTVAAVFVVLVAALAVAFAGLCTAAHGADANGWQNTLASVDADAAPVGHDSNGWQ